MNLSSNCWFWLKAMPKLYIFFQFTLVVRGPSNMMHICRTLLWYAGPSVSVRENLFRPGIQAGYALPQISKGQTTDLSRGSWQTKLENTTRISLVILYEAVCVLIKKYSSWGFQVASLSVYFWLPILTCIYTHFLDTLQKFPIKVKKKKKSF